MNQDEYRRNRIKMIMIGGSIAIVLGVAIIIAAILLSSSRENTSGDYVQDEISGETVFSDENQGPEAETMNGMIPIQGSQELYNMVQPYQFTIIRNTIDAYVRSKIGSTSGQVAYILGGDATKNNADIFFNLRISPANLNIGAKVFINDTGKVAVYFDNSAAPFDATTIPAAAAPTDAPGDPLLASLPHQTNHFKMSYAFRDPVNKTGPILSVKLFATNNKPDPAIKKIYEQDLKNYREEALSYIRSKGVDPANYAIFYNPDPERPYGEQH